MFDDLSPQDFVFKARDVFSNNAAVIGEQQRYNANYYAMQRIQRYLKEHRRETPLYMQGGRLITKTLMSVTPYNESNALKLQLLANSCFASFDELIKNYVHKKLPVEDVPTVFASGLIRLLQNAHVASHPLTDVVVKSSTKRLSGAIGSSDTADMTDPVDLVAAGSNEDRYSEMSESSDEEFDSNEYAIPVAQMSMSLRRALGLNNVGDEDDIYKKMAAKSDWRAPEKYGLSNSAVIVSTGGVEDNKKFRNQLVNQLSPPLFEKWWLLTDEDEDDSEEEEEEEEYDDTEYETPVAQMSLSLQLALGLITADEAKEQAEQERRLSDWQPPQTFGLSNSEPIRNFAQDKLPSIFAQHSYSLRSSEERERFHFQREEKSYQRTDHSFLNDTLQRPAAQNQPKNQTLSTNIEQFEDVEDDDEDDESDEDDEEDEDDDDDEFPRGAMSLSLMKALGMDTTGMEVETDWKPPEQSGLEYSEPIFTVTRD